MQIDNYEINKEFMQKYLRLLTSEGFCTVLRFLLFYFENGKKKEFKISPYIFQKHFLVTDDKERLEAIWGELDYWNLLKRDYVNNTYSFHIEFESNKKLDFLVQLLQTPIKFKRKKSVDVYLENYILKIVTSFSNPRLQQKISELISGHIKYILGEKGSISVLDIKELTDPFYNIPQIVLEKTCDVYITNYYAKKPASYIHGIMNKLKQERVVKTPEEDDVKTLNFKQFKKEIEENKKQLALQIAIGDINNNLPYQAHLRTKDFKNLNDLYELGKEILSQENRLEELKEDYEWLSYDK